MVMKGALIGSRVNKIAVLLTSLLAAKRKGHKPSNWNVLYIIRNG